MVLRSSVSAMVVSSLLVVVGCQGKLGVSASLGSDRDLDGQPGGGDNGSGDGVRDDRLGDVPAECMGAVFQSSSAPLRRLSQREYENTMKALFPGADLPSLEVVADQRLYGFDNAADGQSPSALAAEQYARTAEAVAAAAVNALSSWAPCSQETAECARMVIDALAPRLYRRPLTGEEQAEVSGLLDGALGLGTPREGLQLAMSALLESPNFLFRPEFGSDQEIGTGAVELSAYELASRLSYFVTASMPDDSLMAAAADGSLLSPATLRAQAERLLSDKRARPALNDFFGQWLGLYKLEGLSLDPSVFPEFDESLRTDLEASADAYIDHALWKADSYTALMAGSYGFVNDRLAPLFGVPAPGSEELVYTELDPAERRGILTQPSLLSATSHGIRHSPILRGVHLLNQVLCADLPAPPPGILAMAEDLVVDESLVCTTRDEVSMTHTAKAGCDNCHDSIDAAGFNFENYDALGRYRSEENGCAVDASGSYPGTDLDGEFVDAVALAAQLPQSRTVSGCMTEHLFRYALGRKSERDDACEVASLAEQLHSGDSLQHLVIELVMSPSFRSRPSF